MLGPLIVDIAGVNLDASDRELLAHPLIGGVILFARNAPDAASVAALAAEIHALRMPSLLVTMDQEGGRVQRLHEGVTRLPPAARFGELWDENPAAGRALARDTGWLMAAELLALGVDLSFAPVVDLGGRSRVIGDRAFHRDADAVAELGLAWMRGMADAGMRAVAKHFPGHGGVAGDTHVERPVDRRRYADLALADLKPFERLIANGLAGVMTSHVIYPEVAPEPASLSRRWVHELLRVEMGFQGAIVADDLSMDAAGAGGRCLGARARRVGGGLRLCAALQRSRSGEIRARRRGNASARAGRGSAPCPACSAGPARGGGSRRRSAAQDDARRARPSCRRRNIPTRGLNMHDRGTAYVPPGELIHDAETVRSAIARQADALRPQLEGENPLVLVLMQGALYYAAWLTLALAIPLELDYVHVSRYRDQKTGGELVWQRAPGASIAGRSVLVVDDIFDEGATLAAVRVACIEAGARELHTAVMTRKLHDRAQAPLPESIALDVPDRFVVGCGLDYAGCWRNLPAIYALDDDALV